MVDLVLFDLEIVVVGVIFDDLFVVLEGIVEVLVGGVFVVVDG